MLIYEKYIFLAMFWSDKLLKSSLYNDLPFINKHMNSCSLFLKTITICVNAVYLNGTIKITIKPSHRTIKTQL
jgi:hypothetical protein